MSKKYKIVKKTYDNGGFETANEVLAETNSFLCGLILLMKLFDKDKKYKSNNFRTEVGNVVTNFGRRCDPMIIRVYEKNELDWCFLRAVYALKRN